MGNKLTFCNAMFIAFLFGKLGHIGAFAAMPWVVIFIPLMGDVILDTLNRLGLIRNTINRIDLWNMKRRLNNISDKVKKDIK